MKRDTEIIEYFNFSFVFFSVSFCLFVIVVVNRKHSLA